MCSAPWPRCAHMHSLWKHFTGFLSYFTDQQEISDINKPCCDKVTKVDHFSTSENHARVPNKGKSEKVFFETFEFKLNSERNWSWCREWNYFSSLVDIQYFDPMIQNSGVPPIKGIFHQCKKTPPIFNLKKKSSSPFHLHPYTWFVTFTSLFNPIFQKKQNLEKN